MSLEQQGEEVLAVVDRTIEKLLERAGVLQPPVDAIRLAQGTLGMYVCLDTRQQARGRAQRTGFQRQVYLRPEPTEERHQWTVAHEIGEHLKSEMLEELGVCPESTGAMAGETLANLFAHRLLVPAAWFSGDAAACHYDLLALKNRYRTPSHEVIALRLLDLPAPCIITVVDNKHIHRRLSNAWPVTRQLQPIERACQEYVHLYSRPYRLEEAGCAVAGWPVHQPDWKREILRSVVTGPD